MREAGIDLKVIIIGKKQSSEDRTEMTTLESLAKVTYQVTLYSSPLYAMQPVMLSYSTYRLE